jgi:hypothetical protein
VSGDRKHALFLAPEDPFEQAFSHPSLRLLILGLWSSTRHVLATDGQLGVAQRQVTGAESRTSIYRFWPSGDDRVPVSGTKVIPTRVEDRTGKADCRHRRPRRLRTKGPVVDRPRFWVGPTVPLERKIERFLRETVVVFRPGAVIVNVRHCLVSRARAPSRIAERAKQGCFARSFHGRIHSDPTWRLGSAHSGFAR